MMGTKPTALRRRAALGLVPACLGLALGRRALAADTVRVVGSADTQHSSFEAMERLRRDIDAMTHGRGGREPERLERGEGRARGGADVGEFAGGGRESSSPPVVDPELPAPEPDPFDGAGGEAGLPLRELEERQLEGRRAAV